MLSRYAGLLLLASSVFLSLCAVSGCKADNDFDTAAPTPGDDGFLNAREITGTTVTLEWTKADDRVWPQRQLRYMVLSSSTNNLGTVEAAVANGTVEIDRAQDIDEAVVMNLAPETTYYFTVLVEDPVGNLAVYTTVEVMTLVFRDQNPPTPGGGGIFAVSPQSGSTVRLTWVAGTDDISTQPNLEYKVMRSVLDNIGTFLDAELNGTLVMDWTAATTTITATNLLPDSRYFFNVLVRDEAGNPAPYMSRAATTLAGGDVDFPVPGNAGMLTTSSVTATGLTLTWTAATDNVTVPGALEYQVVWSANDDIQTPSAADANGTILVDWTPNLTTVDASNLSPATTYYFNVLVRDQAMNRAAYTSVSDTTL